MAEKNPTVQTINDFIQAKMKEMHIDSVTPVQATKWLVEAGLREKIESRPGIYLRKLCRKGKIVGAEQIDRSWIIKRR
jgi:hypothetical protein